MWKEASKRQERRPKSASGPVRRLATRKEVMAQQTGAASDVSVWPLHSLSLLGLLLTSDQHHVLNSSGRTIKLPLTPRINLVDLFTGVSLILQFCAGIPFTVAQYLRAYLSASDMKSCKGP